MIKRVIRLAGAGLLVLAMAACATAPASQSKPPGPHDREVAGEEVEVPQWRNWLAQAWAFLNQFVSVQVSGGFGIQSNGIGGPNTPPRQPGESFRDFWNRASKCALYQVPAPYASPDRDPDCRPPAAAGVSGNWR